MAVPREKKKKKKLPALNKAGKGRGDGILVERSGKSCLKDVIGTEI